MKINRRIISLAIMLCLVFSFSAVAYADVTATEARQSVAVLATYVQINNESPELYSCGTCVFVGEKGKDVQYLLTNHHVVQDYIDYGKGELISNGDATLKMILRVYFSANDYTEAYVVESDSAQDIALLRLASPTNKRSSLKVMIPDDSLVGSQVYSIGYPGYADDKVVDPTSTWGINDSLVTRGTVGRLLTRSGHGTRWIQLADTQWNHGNSGGPLVNEKGVMVGLVSSGYSDGSADMYVAANIERAVVMMNNNGIKFDLVGEGFPVEIILAVAGVLVLAAIIILIVNKKKTGTKIDPTPTYKRRATVRSLAAQHGGMRVDVSQQIMIGRANNCQIRFAEGTPGISSVHCSISWDENTGEFILMDLKSSYGTFLETGMKLTPHTPYRLRNGDSFYLAEAKNTLRVEVE